MTSPAAVNAILEPFLTCINDHSGALTKSFEFSAQILASLPKLAAAGPGLSQILLTLANPRGPSSAFAPVLRFLGPDILTRMGFSTAEKKLFICWTGMKFYIAEAAKAGLRAFTDPGAMCAALASDPAAKQLAFHGPGPSPSFCSQDFRDYFEIVTHAFSTLAKGQGTGADKRPLPPGLLLQDLRGDLQATIIMRFMIGRTDLRAVSFFMAVVQGISTWRLKFDLASIIDVFRPPFFSDPAAAVRAAGVLKNLDGKLMDVCSSLFMRTHKPEGPLSLARVAVTRPADAQILVFSPRIPAIIGQSWFMGAALAKIGFPEIMPFVRQSGSVALCMAEASEAASRVGVGPAAGMVGGRGDADFAIRIMEGFDPVLDMYYESRDEVLLFMLRESERGPGVARTVLMLARIARRSMNLALPHLDPRAVLLGTAATHCITRVSGLALRLVRYGAISAHDAAIVIAELAKPAFAMPPTRTVVTASAGMPAPSSCIMLPSTCFFELSLLVCVTARDPAALCMLRRSLGAIRSPSTGERADRDYAAGFVLMMNSEIVPALWGSGALALGRSNHANQVRQHFTPEWIADLIDGAGKSKRPSPEESIATSLPQSFLLVGLASILQDYALGPGIDGAGGRCWDIWGRKDVNLGPLLDAISLGPVPHAFLPQTIYGFSTLVYQPYLEILAVIGKTLHLARRAALGRIRAGLLGPEAEQRVVLLDQWRQRAREINRRFLFGLLPQAEEEDNVRKMGPRDGRGSKVAPLEDLLRELDAVEGAMQA